MVSFVLELTYVFTCQEMRLKSRIQHNIHLVCIGANHQVFIYRIEHRQEEHFEKVDHLDVSAS